MKKSNKVIFTLNTDPVSYKEITDLTYPFLKFYAKKIGAEFYEIKDRKFPEAKSITYEKCQVYKLAQEMECEWVYFIDADALIHPFQLFAGFLRFLLAGLHEGVAGGDELRELRGALGVLALCHRKKRLVGHAVPFIARSACRAR